MHSLKISERPITCHRCNRKLDPDRADLDRWLVLDAREDGWVFAVCSNCQTDTERQRIQSLS